MDNENLNVADQAVALLNDLPEEEQLKIIDYIKSYIEAIEEQKNESK